MKEKKGSSVLVIIIMFLLLLIIVLPPVFRKYIPKEKKLSELNKVPQITSLMCRKNTTDNYLVATNTIYNKGIVTKISYTYTKQENTTPNTTSTIVDNVAGEIETWKSLTNIKFEETETSTKFILDSAFLKTNDTNEIIVSRTKALEEVKTFYTGLGYTCTVAET